MKTSDFDFDLPESFIANDPVEPRDHSKLMVIDTERDVILHKRFFEIGEFLEAGDALVMNASKVIPARVSFEFEGKSCEIFVLKNLGEDKFQAMVRPGKMFSVGQKIDLDMNVNFEVLEVLKDGTRILQFSGDFDLEKYGSAPLPPYIKNSQATLDRYQTVYAKDKGSVAAPTAGLHFTDDLLASLRSEGISTHEVILHVGRGTFMPVKADDVSEHVMHFEEFVMPDAVAADLSAVEGRIVAVGTTSVRVLESTHVDQGFKAQSSSTDLFIRPGAYRWKAVDALITNFHLPKSTLLMLVASFLENKGCEKPIEKVLEIYELAKRESYRFYSFGDAMLII